MHTGPGRPSHSPDSPPIVRKRVLIVEDSYDNRVVYSDLLRHAGYEVEEASNGRKGVEQALRDPPDLILMDLSMPVMDGWEAVRILKSDPRTSPIPILALSAHVILDRDYAKAEEAGFSCYLTKPIEPKDVLREIETRIGPAGDRPPAGGRPTL
jgi:two-component system, cell cycle response regulator DivK